MSDRLRSRADDEGRERVRRLQTKLLTIPIRRRMTGTAGTCHSALVRAADS